MSGRYQGGALVAAGFLTMIMCPDIVFSAHVITPATLIIVGLILFILGGNDGGPKGGSKSDIGEKPARHFYNFNLSPGAV